MAGAGDRPEALDAAAFKACYRGRGWTGRLLAARWARSEAWISKLGSDVARDAHWNDAVTGLPGASGGGGACVMAPDEVKALYRGKGWTGRLLAERWGKSVTWVSKVVNNPDRGLHWDDAFRGIPSINRAKKGRQK